MPKQFEKIVTHQRPHLDEIFAIWLLREFGEEKFPGIETAEIVFWNAGGENLDGRIAEDYEQEGTLLVGVGGGRFDEHPRKNGERKEGECAATLVAKALGLDGDPALTKILDYVVKSDLQGSGHPLHLGPLVNLLNTQHPDDPEKVIDWTITVLDAKYQEQLAFWGLTREEFERVAEVEMVPGPGGQLVKMATIVSDNEQIVKFARSEAGGQAAIVIQQRSSGNVQIFVKQHFGLTLYDVAQMVRLEEQRAKGKIVTTGWKRLAAEGVVKGAEEWYFHPGLQVLLNGSLTAKDVSPTRLSLEQIKELVRIGINPQAFEPERAYDCEHKICTSTEKNRCPWYRWGLHRCRCIRWEMHKANKANQQEANQMSQW